MPGPLNNARLHETHLPSAEYNRLPLIDKVKEADTKNEAAHTALLGIIYEHELENTFSLRLIHRRFDIPEGRIMVNKKISGRNPNEDFVLCSPRTPKHCPHTRGLYFKAIPGGDMVACEFTTEPGADLSAHKGFLAKFASAALEHGVQDLFGLTALSLFPTEVVLSEFAIAQIHSTVLLTTNCLPPPGPGNITPYTATEWAGFVKTLFHIHRNVTCKNNGLTIDGANIQGATDQYKIIYRAFELAEYT